MSKRQKNNNDMSKVASIGKNGFHEKRASELGKILLTMSKAARPNILFISALPGKDMEQCKTFNDIYSAKLNCETTELLPLLKEYSDREMEEKISQANIIFIGNSNMFKLMRRFRSLGLVGLLRKAYRQGKTMVGLGEGAGCWFEFGLSDKAYSRRFTKVRGLSFIDRLFLCPDYVAGTPMAENFSQQINRFGGVGIGIPPDGVLLVEDGKFKAFSYSEQEAFCKIQKVRAGINQTELPSDGQWHDLGELVGR